MRFRVIAIGVAAAVVLAAGAYFILSAAAERQAQARKTAELVAEGFGLLDRDADAAIRLALEARSIEPEYLPAFILQGRANFLKGKYDDSVRVFEEAANVSRDLDMHPELSYHIGRAKLLLYQETGIKEYWREAFKHLSDAATLGNHAADANIALGFLYVTEENLNKKMVLLYWDRAFRLQAELTGYQSARADGACPHCGQAFTLWRDQKSVDNLYAFSSQK